MHYYKEDGLTLQLNLKSLCNLDCDYCLLPKHVKSQNDSTKDIIDNTHLLVQKLDEENDFIKAFAIFGAEPFTVEAEVMAEVFNIIAEKFPEAFLKVQTNGTLCTEKYMTKFLDVFKYPEKLLMGFSIDGVKDIHDKHRCKSWNLIMKNFRWIKRNTSIRTNVICTTNNEHFDSPKYEQELLEFIKMMENLYDTNVTISYADLTIRGVGESHIGESRYSKNFARFLIENDLINNCIKLFRPNYCYRKGNTCDKVLLDLGNGNTYQCEKKFIPDGSFTNWKENSIHDTMIKRFDQTKNYPIAEECYTCEFREWCNGGCPLKRDKDGLAKSCYVTKTVLTHIKDNLNDNWVEYLYTGNITKDTNEQDSKYVFGVNQNM